MCGRGVTARARDVGGSVGGVDASTKGTDSGSIGKSHFLKVLIGKVFKFGQVMFLWFDEWIEPHIETRTSFFETRSDLLKSCMIVLWQRIIE